MDTDTECSYIGILGFPNVSHEPMTHYHLKISPKNKIMLYSKPPPKKKTELEVANFHGASEAMNGFFQHDLGSFRLGSSPSGHE